MEQKPETKENNQDTTQDEISRGRAKTQEAGHVRTFAKDAALHMKTNSASVVKIALAEQGREREYESIVKNTKKQQIIFLVLTFIFFVGGGIILALVTKNDSSPVPLSKPIQQEKVNSLIFSDQQIIVDTTGLERAQLVATILEKISFVKESGMTNVITTVQESSAVRVSTGTEFLKSIAQNIPETIFPLLVKDFMIGVDGNNDFAVFMVFSFNSFDLFVDAMREWEAFFVQDMSTLLSIQTGGQLEIFSRPFDSEILFNKESRVLRDKNQGFVVGYTFLDRKTMVISTNVNTIRDVVERFSIQAIK